MPRKAGFRIERPPVDRSRLGKSDTAPSLMTSVPFLFSRGRTMKQGEIESSSHRDLDLHCGSKCMTLGNLPRAFEIQVSHL